MREFLKIYPARKFQIINRNTLPSNRRSLTLPFKCKVHIMLLSKEALGDGGRKSNVTIGESDKSQSCQIMAAHIEFDNSYG